MRRLIIVPILSLTALACQEPIVTIVDTSHNSRSEIARQLHIIRTHSPKLVALDILFVSDSLETDSSIIYELSRIPNLVHAARLTDFNAAVNSWTALQTSQPKFYVNHVGFVNLPTYHDSVLWRDMPVTLSYGDSTLFAFSYVAARNSFGVRPEYRHPPRTTLPIHINRFDKRYRIIRSHDLLSGHFQPRHLKDQIVLLGYLGDRQDFFYLDELRQKRINGVEVHATIIGTIVDH